MRNAILPFFFALVLASCSSTETTTTVAYERDGKTVREVTVTKADKADVPSITRGLAAVGKFVVLLFSM